MFRELIKLAFGLVVIAGVLVALLRIFFVDVAVVGHNGMAPTLVAGDYVAIWRRARSMSVGDVVMCTHPANPKRPVLGRVLALPGALIETPGGNFLTINGRPISQLGVLGEVEFEDTLAQRKDLMQWAEVEVGGVKHGIFTRKFSQFLMRPAHVRDGLFLLGDNRSGLGDDSRFFGEVDPKKCLGTVFMRLSPGDHTAKALDHGWFDIVH